MKAFLFAGQGAQVPGMAAELQDNPRVAALFAKADKICPGIVDTMLNGTKEQLAITKNTQPCMFLADLSYAYAAEAESGAPNAVCGFSVGEVPALVYSGVLSEEDGLKVIVRRAELMQKACEIHGGAMVAVVGLEPDAVEKIAASCDEAWAVNYNAPNQTVIACAEKSLPMVTAKVSDQKGRAIRLNVSGAFHCPYLNDASAAFLDFLREIPFNAPKIPVYANLTAQPYTGDFAMLLATQMKSPVRFTQTIQNLHEMGVRTFTEVGPGRVLTGLVGKILK